MCEKTNHKQLKPNTMDLHPVCIRTRKGWYVIEVKAASMYEAVKRAEKQPHVSRAKAYVEGC